MSEKLHHVFISYSTIDSETAFALLRVLEGNGLKCWIAPRDIPQGAQWADEIDRAIQNARVFVVIVSSNAIDSKQVPKEIALAVSACEGVFPFRIDRAALQGSFRYYLSDYQFVDAIQEREVKMQQLADSIRSTLHLGPYVPPMPERTPASAPAQQPDASAPKARPAAAAVPPAPTVAPSTAAPLPFRGSGSERQQGAASNPEGAPVLPSAGRKPDKPKKKKLPLILALLGVLIVGAVLAVILSGQSRETPSDSGSDVLSSNAPQNAPTPRSRVDAILDAASAAEPSPLVGRWNMVASEHRGAKLNLVLDTYSLDNFSVNANGFVYSSISKYFQNVEKQGCNVVWEGSQVNFQEVFVPNANKDAYTLQTTCFFLDDFDGTIPTKDGDTTAPTYQAPDFSNLDPSLLKWEDCYPARYLVIHYTGSYQESPVSTLPVDTWLVFQKKYPVFDYSTRSSLVGRWDDNRGNSWEFYPYNDNIVHSITTPDGTTYKSTGFVDYEGDPKKEDFFERISITFDEFSMHKYAVVWFDGNVLCLLDDQNQPFVMTRK